MGHEQRSEVRVGDQKSEVVKRTVSLRRLRDLNGRVS
jgi:hypothetical protein